MARFFAPLTEEELNARINPIIEEDGMYNLIENLGSDIKVKFDLENTEMNSGNPKGLMGFVTLPNGMTFIGCTAGGDWEHPVFFILYFDGKKLRGYVPTEGNPWNTTTKEAYGNDDVADGKNAHKRWPDIYDGDSVEGEDFQFNPDEIQKDIMERIKPIGLPPLNKKLLAESKASRAKGEKGIEIKQLIKQVRAKIVSPKELIESLTFYGTGDEAYELFCQTCEFAYKLNGLGEVVKSLVVASWAAEMAEASYSYAQQEGNLDDKEEGVWGR